MSFKLDDNELLKQEYGWNENKKFHYNYDLKLTAGKHDLTLDLEPLKDSKERINSLDLQLVSARLEGPLENEFRVATKNYDRFFTKDSPPESNSDRRAYAHEVLKRFAQKSVSPAR